MQCRNALRQHVASSTAFSTRSSSDHIWVSDELLNDAFTRYMRISNTARRYGSSIPGPLEARRRQSKRRMGFVAGEHGQTMPLTDFGALFGAGQNTPGTFSWQPPSKPIAQSQVTQDNLGVPHPSNPFWRLSLLARDRGQVAAAKEEVVREQVDPVVVSRVEFQTLLDKQTSSLELEPVLAFLESDKDEALAKNFELLVHWLKGKPIGVAAFEQVRDILLSKHRLQTISTPRLADLIPPLCALAKAQQQAEWRAVYSCTISKLSDYLSTQIHAAPGNRRLLNAYTQLFKATLPRSGFRFSSQALQILGTMVQQRDAINISIPLVARSIVGILSRLVTSQLRADRYQALKSLLVNVLRKSRERYLVQNVTKLLIAQEVGVLSPTVRRKRLTLWLNSVHQSGLLSCNGQISEDWIANWSVYHIVGGRYSPTDLTSHMSKLSRIELATALVLGWTGRVNAVPALRRDRSVQPYRGMMLDKHQYAFLQELHSTNLSAIQDPLLSLMLFAGRQEYDLEQLLKHILSSLDNGEAGLDAQLAFYKTVQQIPDLIIAPDVQQDMIARLAEARRILEALQILLDSPSVSYEAVARLPERLLESDVGPRLVLERIREHHNKQKGSKRERFLAQNMIDFVLQLAWAISQSNRFSPTAAFHSVWRCYRFLHDRDIRMDATISKAAFHAGVVRVLKTQSKVPARRLKYIMQLVRWYEGDAVADRLEQTVALTRRTVSPLQRRHDGHEKAPFQYNGVWRLKLRPRF